MYLMHKDIPVAQFDENSFGDITAVHEMFSKEHLPYELAREKRITPRLLATWEKNRAIPDDRIGLNILQNRIGMPVDQAKAKMLAISLTDCYWHKPEGSDLKWNDVDFHGKTISKDISNIFLFQGITNETKHNIDIRTPDFTTDGSLDKTWITVNKEPFLLKRGKIGEYAEGKNLTSANEVAAYKVARLFDIDCVKYSPVQLNSEEMVCVCPCFINTADQEFVSAFECQSNTLLFKREFYNWFKRNGFKADVDKMILYDNIIHNSDRHEKNFGLIRNPDTLEFISFAPLFDNGSSFGYNGEKEFEKPFFQTRREHLQLLSLIPELPDIEDIKDIIKSSYEIFQISEKAYQNAVNDLNNSYQLILIRKREIQKNLIFGKDER